MPSLSVVAVITVPSGLIRTTVALGIATLFASNRCPVILTVERSREATLFTASSDVGSGVVVGAGVASGVGAGVASGVGVGGGGVSTATISPFARRSSRPFVEPLMLRYSCSMIERFTDSGGPAL